MENMRCAEYLLADEDPKAALDILRHLKQGRIMPNQFGGRALTKAERLFGDSKKARSAMEKYELLEKRTKESRYLSNHTRQKGLIFE